MLFLFFFSEPQNIKKVLIVGKKIILDTGIWEVAEEIQSICYNKLLGLESKFRTIKLIKSWLITPVVYEA